MRENKSSDGEEQFYPGKDVEKPDTINGGITSTQGSTAFCSQLPDVFNLFSSGWDDHFYGTVIGC